MKKRTIEPLIKMKINVILMKDGRTIGPLI